MHILLIAEESVGINFIRYLENATSHKVTIMASPARQTLSGATTWSSAEQLGLTRIPASEIKQPGFPEWMKHQGIDVMLSVRSRYIVPERVLRAPKLGAFNLHSGPLPGYAGINVINWAIYNGETRHAVTLHRMAPQVDAGAIVYTADIEINANDSAAIITKKCFREGLVLLQRLVSELESDPHSIPCIEQDLSKSRWYGPGIPHNGFIPWCEGAQRATDFVRACSYFPFPSPWGIAKTNQDGHEIGLLKAFSTDHPSDKPAGYVGELRESGVAVSAGDFWVVATEALINDERVSAGDVLRPGALLKNA